MRGRSGLLAVLLCLAACTDDESNEAGEGGRGGAGSGQASIDLPPDFDGSRPEAGDDPAQLLELHLPFCERSHVKNGDRCGDAWCGAPQECVKHTITHWYGSSEYAACQERVPDDFSACTISCLTPDEPGCACPAGEPIEQLWTYRAQPNRLIDGPALMDSHDNIWFVEVDCMRWFERELVSLTFDGVERFREPIAHWYAPATVVGDVLIARTASIAPHYEGRDVGTGEVLWRRQIEATDLTGHIPGRAGWLEVAGGVYGASYASPDPSVFTILIDAVGQPYFDPPQPGAGTPKWLVALDAQSGAILWNKGRLASGGPVREDGATIVIEPIEDTASFLAADGSVVRQISADGEQLPVQALRGDLAYHFKQVRDLDTGRIIGELPSSGWTGESGLPWGPRDTSRVIGDQIGYSVYGGSGPYRVIGFDTATGKLRWDYKLGEPWVDRTHPIVTNRDTLLVTESRKVDTPPGAHSAYRAILYEMDGNADIVQKCDLPLETGWTYSGYPLLRKERLIVPERDYRWRLKADTPFSRICGDGVRYGLRAFSLPDRDLSPVGWPARYGHHDGSRRARAADPVD